MLHSRHYLQNVDGKQQGYCDLFSSRCLVSSFSASLISLFTIIGSCLISLSLFLFLFLKYFHFSLDGGGAVCVCRRLCDLQGWTALILAAYHGHTDCARLLIDAGVDKEGTADRVRVARCFAGAIFFSFSVSFWRSMSPVVCLIG